MSHCLNPSCPQPENPDGLKVCQSCGSDLLLHKRFYIRKILGQGGFGATFLANDLSLPAQPACVVKQLRPSNSDKSFLRMARELFGREAKTLGQLGDHPQVPRLLAYFEADGNFYLVQEFVKGRNLQQEVKKDGPFSEAGVRQFLSEILPILGHIHSHEVIHRDIKPANIIRRDLDKKLVLIDFGAVKNEVSQADAANPDITALTQFAVGTPGFAPPEQMAMRPVYASDIYGLGITCIYLLVGKSPKDLGYNPLTGSIQWEQHVNISEHLRGVLSRMLEMAVRDRYQTAENVLRALDMEPYLDSLAEGLVNAPQPLPRQEPVQKTDRYGRSYTSGTEHTRGGRSTRREQASRLAETIRRQREQRESGRRSTGSLGGSGALTDRNRYLSGQIAGTGHLTNAARKPAAGRDKRAALKRIDAATLLEAYGKGRRDFCRHNLRQLDLQEAELSQVLWRECNLTQINFRKAELQQANFAKSVLKQANFEKAKLLEAFFGGADLEGADLRGAELQRSDFEGANLKGANLCGANLTGAKIGDEQLEAAKTNWSTVRPDGKRTIF
ncbi:MAG: serine/threonine-protein kinase [Cyanobacteria bacterium J06641_5]